ncbi:hypothetical protein V1283_002124 [Bradyrhizobium sp. AZCC 2262]|uniref:hypothetical protein n=1 Tax=Bradyrhizobium sp. AZCC 2262 TaxID=3117022 RepID=UPI002FEFB10D
MRADGSHDWEAKHQQEPATSSRYHLDGGRTAGHERNMVGRMIERDTHWTSGATRTSSAHLTRVNPRKCAFANVFRDAAPRSSA